MAVVEGTNAGFVTARPTGDPEGGAAAFTQDNLSIAGRFVAPAGATAITEIGWYCHNATEAADYEVGVYDDDGSSPYLPTNRRVVVTGQAKGTTAGWKYAAVSPAHAITAGTAYWLASQLDNTATETYTAAAATGGRNTYMSGQSALAASWSSSGVGDDILAIYAVYTTGGGSIAAIAGTLNRRRRG